MDDSVTEALKHERARLAFDFLAKFYVSDIDPELKESAKRYLLEYFKAI